MPFFLLLNDYVCRIIYKLMNNIKYITKKKFIKQQKKLNQIYYLKQF